MKATIINGCEESSQLLESVLNTCLKGLECKHIESSLFHLREIQPKPCTGCDYCQTKNPGICAITDGVGEIWRQYLNNEIAILISPILFGCFNSLTKNFVDRAEPLCIPYQVIHNGNTVMRPRYDRYPNLLIIGLAQDENSCPDIFRQAALNSIFAHFSEHSVVEIIEAEKDAAELSAWLNSVISERRQVG